MADLGTMKGNSGSAGSSEQDDRRSTGRGRTVRRARGLPRGRAVVGAFLVSASAVAVFAAYLDARGEPDISYLVAGSSLEPGTRFTSVDEVFAAFGAAPVDLIPELAARAIPVDDAELLVGWVVVAPLEHGDLVTRSAVVPDEGVGGAQTMSFSLPRAAAVGGTLRAGEHVDVLATYGTGGNAYTDYVVRGVPLLQVAAQDGGPLGGSGDITLTVAIEDLVDVQALGHAVNVAAVFVTRSTLVGPSSSAPGSYVPAPSDAELSSEGPVGTDGADGGTDGDAP